MNDLRSIWQGRLVNQLQGPSSLGMALSGSAVGFSASILDPQAYVGFWTSVAFQMHVGFQSLSLAFGLAFVICRLKSSDVTFRIEKAKRQQNAPVEGLDELLRQSSNLANATKSTLYAQLGFLFVGAVSFIWLMLLHFQRALYA